MFSSTARYSRASSVAAGEAGGSTMVSAWTHRAWPVPGTAGPMAARSHAADDHGVHASRQLTRLDDIGDHAHVGIPAVDVGDDDEMAVGGSGGVNSRPGLLGLEGHGEDHSWEHNSRGQW